MRHYVGFSQIGSHIHTCSLLIKYSYIHVRTLLTYICNYVVGMFMTELLKRVTQKHLLSKYSLKIHIYRNGVYFTPLKFHEFHELFWIREIKFVKSCRNVVAILVKTHGFVKIYADIQFLKNLWKYTSAKITPYTVYIVAWLKLLPINVSKLHIRAQKCRTKWLLANYIYTISHILTIEKLIHKQSLRLCKIFINLSF